MYDDEQSFYQSTWEAGELATTKVVRLNPSRCNVEVKSLLDDKWLDYFKSLSQMVFFTQLLKLCYLGWDFSQYVLTKIAAAVFHKAGAIFYFFF